MLDELVPARGRKEDVAKMRTLPQLALAASLLAGCEQGTAVRAVASGVKASSSALQLDFRDELIGYYVACANHDDLQPWRVVLDFPSKSDLWVETGDRTCQLWLSKIQRDTGEQYTLVARYDTSKRTPIRIQESYDPVQTSVALRTDVSVGMQAGVVNALGIGLDYLSPTFDLHVVTGKTAEDLIQTPIQASLDDGGVDGGD